MTRLKVSRLKSMSSLFDSLELKKGIKAFYVTAKNRRLILKWLQQLSEKFLNSDYLYLLFTHILKHPLVH